MTITPAAITWNDHGAPFNTHFGDIYFSHDGDAEVQRVFIQPAALDSRLQSRQRFTIAELGFGSALNFITLAALAIRAGCRLHFLTVELTPFRRADLARTRTRYRDALAQSLLDELVEVYPPLLSGWHRRQLAGGRITLSLYFGDVHDFVSDLGSRQAAGVDAWLLDGFAPEKNPRMWADSLFPQMALACRSGATVTTFTSAGRVRRALQSAGFEMRRVDQRPLKRESLAGAWIGERDTPTIPEQVQIVGAGIAGCSLAAHLAAQGIAVRLVEPFAAIATGASRMCAVQHARLLPDGSAQADWRVSSHLYSLAHTRGHDGVHPLGTLQLPGPNLDLPRLQRTLECYADSGEWLSAADAQDVARMAGPFALSATGTRAEAGLVFQGAPVVELDRLCRSLITQPGIELCPNGAVVPELPTVWANAHGIADIPVLSGLPTHSLWGQTELVRLADTPALAIIGDGYLAPCRGQVWVGSTFEYSAWQPDRATATNLARLGTVAHVWQDRRRAARLTTPDRMPIVGPIGDGWVTTAHGSMGATSAHLAASVIQSQIMGWVPPIAPAVGAIIDPGRFAARAARRLNRR